MASDPSAWVAFAAAIVAAASALTGLIFVALSINLDRILALGGIADLALEGVVGIGTVLVAAILVLIPGQPADLLAQELVVLGAVHILVMGELLRRTLRSATPDYRGKRFQMALINGFPGLLFLAGGASLWSDQLGGLYWLVPASILGMTAGIVNAWVLLVEIKR